MTVAELKIQIFDLARKQELVNLEWQKIEKEKREKLFELEKLENVNLPNS